MRLEILSEEPKKDPDQPKKPGMSRRDFLKNIGKGAMAAANPEGALKGLIGSGTPTAGFQIPKTPVEMKAAILKLIKDRNLESIWAKNADEYIADQMKQPDFNAQMNKRKKTIEAFRNELIEGDRNELMYYAGKFDDVTLEDLNHVLSGLEDDLRMQEMWGGPIPEWVTRYRVSQFLGRDVGMDHPFVKDRLKWYQYMGNTSYEISDVKMENEFLNIIKSSASPKRIKEIFGTANPKPVTQDELDKQRAEMHKSDVDERGESGYDKDERKDEFDQAPPAPEEPDSWRTQHVEFEHKLVARLRRL